MKIVKSKKKIQFVILVECFVQCVHLTVTHKNDLKITLITMLKITVIYIF